MRATWLRLPPTRASCALAAISEFGEGRGEHDVAGLGVHALEDRGHSGGDTLTYVGRTAEERVQHLERQRLRVLEQQIRIAHLADLIDQRKGDLLHRGPQFVLVDVVQGGRVRGPVTSVSGSGTA